MYSVLTVNIKTRAERKTFNSVIWLLGLSIYVCGGRTTRRHLKNGGKKIFLNDVILT